MQTCECAREQDVVDAIVTEQWPERAPAELRDHVAVCSICSDLVAIVPPILDDRDHALGESHIPSSAVMWWRAQMRARQEAAREATRPITVAQIVGFTVAVSLTVALVFALSPWLRAWILGLGDTAAFEGSILRVPAAIGAMGWLLPAMFIALWLVLAPLAIYFAVADD